MISSHSEDKEAVLITLNRPLMYIQPIALDKGIMLIVFIYLFLERI